MHDIRVAEIQAVAISTGSDSNAACSLSEMPLFASFTTAQGVVSCAIADQAFKLQCRQFCL